MRSVQKALLYALLEPSEPFKKLQDENDTTTLMAYQEILKEAPFDDIWKEYLNREGVLSEYIEEIKKYETDVLLNRKININMK